MTSGVPLHNLNTRIFKLGGHWWIDIGVWACHGMSKVTRKQRQRTHEGTTNTKNMNVHKFALGQIRISG